MQNVDFQSKFWFENRQFNLFETNLITAQWASQTRYSSNAAFFNSLSEADWKGLTGRSWLERHFRTSSSPAVLAQKFGVQSLSKFSKHQNEMRRISPIFREFCKVLNLKLATPKQPALLGTICNRPEVCVHLLRRNKEIDEKWGTHVCEYSNFNSFDFWGPSVLPIEADSLE